MIYTGVSFLSLWAELCPTRSMCWSGLQYLRKSSRQSFAEASKLKWAHVMTGAFLRREDQDAEADTQRGCCENTSRSSRKDERYLSKVSISWGHWKLETAKEVLYRLVSERTGLCCSFNREMQVQKRSRN